MTHTQETLLTVDFTKVKKISIDFAFAGGFKTIKMSPPKDGELVIIEDTAEIIARKSEDVVVDQLDTTAAIGFTVDYKKS